MPEPPEKPDTPPGTNADLVQWLQEALLRERCELELRHKDMLSELAGRIGSATDMPNLDCQGGSILLPVDQSGDGNLQREEAIEHLVSTPTLTDGAMLVEPTNSGKTVQSPSSRSGPRSPSSRRLSHGASSFISAKDIEKHNAYLGNRSLYNRFVDIINGPYFEVLFGAVIVISAILLAMEMQWRGVETGNRVEYDKYNSNSAEWKWAPDFFHVTEWMLGVFFTIELVLKVMAQCRDFIYDGWNWIDMLIVSSWVSTVVSEADMGFNPIILRLLRLMRLLRLLRLLGMISVFDSLYLMTTAIKGSLLVLVWAVLVLTVVEMSLACLLQSAVEDFLRDPENQGTPHGIEVFKYYGTFARSMLTMFELTLGNWMPPTRALVEHVSEFYMIFFLLHKFIIGFSVVSVITGVFIQETFEVATHDDQIMLNNKRRAARTHEKKMSELFRHADEDGDGSLDRVEFLEVMHDPGVRKWLSSMGLDVDDAATLFELVHGGDNHITAHELVTYSNKLRGGARSIDLVTHISEFRRSHALLQQVHKKLCKVEAQQVRNAVPSFGPVSALPPQIDNDPWPSPNFKDWFGYT
mmetsp:Transcript_108981/g.216450  ORF Transcript_108981/g.216450 Transcript_108981/m.216450 type:complete len:580 (+) Transcript_108981:119-1858(+)